MNEFIDSAVKFMQDQQAYFIGGIFIIMMLAAAGELESLFKKEKEFKDYKPFIISLGILGTFIGIFCGLWDFDTKDIEGSVPSLLEGLKLAFITSILGMLVSAVLSLFEIWRGQKAGESGGPPQDLPQALPQDLPQAMQGILIELKEESQRANQALEQIAGILAARGEVPAKDIAEALRQMISEQEKTNQKADAINSSIQQSGESAGRHFQRISQSLRDVMAALSKGATEEIIKALEKVISDFNSNLTEQFGGNFKQLNESVKKMIAWQENYKAFIEEAETGLQKALANIKEHSVYAEKSAASYEKMAQAGRDLKRILEANDIQIRNMEDGLSSLKNIGEEAGQGVEEIRNLLLAIQETLPGQKALTEELAKQMRISTGNLNEALAKLTDKFRKDYEAYLRRFAQLLEISSSGGSVKAYFERIIRLLEQLLKSKK